ncbi:TVP38/TMEM64 family protein [Oceanobacillus piezotolerans]|uniref:TVP38/TMEM64 family membrane protein n=1 Tax=Oceanobacillus piezotolerans TaxID=2448030 RepID=A0A498DHC7_9BACI|nr:VTT domain-containing protein [Oceanobacillus piezotolerans]RLL47909.1 TVP38/TMEM64 family protein [Oceanobacillus piezotolerans]
MEFFGSYLMAVIQTGGVYGPLLFIGFHLLRPFLFLPVVFICISGGIVFGAVAGTIYSIIGITLSSILFYWIIHCYPKQFERLAKLKQKLLGKYAYLSKGQITILKLIPFIHFHLLSLCLMEITSGFKDYTKSSLLSSIPIAFIYTFVGGWISNLSPIYIFTFLVALLPLIYLLRTKEIIIKWRDFFQVTT